MATLMWQSVAMHILLIDDDRELCALLGRFLEGDGFTVALAHDGVEGLAKIQQAPCDLAVLDVMMPGKSGMDVLRELRSFSSLPVIMLTARGDEMDRIIGLELGADDYLPKPCNPRELSARVRAVLRRSEAVQAGQASSLTVGTLTLQPQARRLLDERQPVELTTCEYNILAMLIEHAGEVVDKQTLSSQALGKRFGAFDRSLDVHIGHIRKKLTPLPNGESPIKTIRAVGWMLVAE